MGIFGTIFGKLLFWRDSRPVQDRITQIREKRDISIAKIEAGRDVRAARREEQLEARIYRGENAALTNAEKLIARDLESVGSHSRQIRELIRLAVNIEGIRDQGQAEAHRQKFKKQARTLISSLSIANATQIELLNITNSLKALVYESDKLTESISAEIRELNMSPLPPNNNRRLEHLERLKLLNNLIAHLVTSTQSVDAISFEISETIKPVTQQNNVAALIQSAMENIVDSSNFAKALTDLQAALSERDAETKILKGIGDLTKRAETLITAQRELISKISRKLAPEEVL
ncbi:hypothetical protein HYY72_04700 [Candidatus Woesearchaeota archaeon]|nr:hypothetical protein [Candidatus Woesearchaeota archaeon]